MYLDLFFYLFIFDFIAKASFSLDEATSRSTPTRPTN